MFGDHHALSADKIDWNRVLRRDERRRDVVQKLLADGKLKTGVNTGLLP
jgi:hypothetical protein